jgi:hypothetical protein
MTASTVTDQGFAVDEAPSSTPNFVNLIPGVSVGPSGVSVSAQPRRKGLILLFVIVMLALPIGGIFLASQAINKATDIISDVPDFFAPEDETTTRGDGTTSMTPAECEDILARYLKKMFFALEKDPDKISDLFIEASVRLGPGSEEYQDLVQIFATQELAGLAATGKPAKAFKGSKKLIEKKCRD